MIIGAENNAMAKGEEQDPTRKWVAREQSLLERAGRLGVEDPALAAALEAALLHMTTRLQATQKT